MRSRLEARYAQSLDALNLKWDYEPRAFGGRGGQYLPDFVLYDGPIITYIEVKPTLEMALAVLPKMQIIRESLAKAWLAVAVGDIGEFVLTPYSDKWRWTPYA